MDEIISETCYHATSVKNANLILNSEFHKSISTKEKLHWLGDGVYFFTDIAWAVQWNINELKKEKNKGKDISKFTIIKSRIEANNDYVFDISSVIGKFTLKILKEELTKKLQAEKKEDLLKKINSRSLKFFMNILDDYGFLNKYYIVKATYIDKKEGKKVCHSDDFILKVQCQICVRNIECIKESEEYKNLENIKNIYDILKSEGDENEKFKRDKKRNTTNSKQNDNK